MTISFIYDKKQSACRSTILLTTYQTCLCTSDEKQMYYIYIIFLTIPTANSNDNFKARIINGSFKSIKILFRQMCSWPLYDKYTLENLLQKNIIVTA